MERRERSNRIPRGTRFRRAQRLRSSRDFQSVRRRGRSVGGALLALGYARQPPATSGVVPSRVGFAISKRVGNAVVRNLVKRRLREAIRRDLSRLAPGWDIVITARPTAASAAYAELRSEMDYLLARAKLFRHKVADDASADIRSADAPHIHTEIEAER